MAKQFWRIIEFSDSLASQILKAKYFPHTDVLNSRLGNNPSQIWRSIRSALDLIREGMLWRIGNNRSVNIWDTNWLPNPSTYWIQSPVSLLDSIAKVESLIDLDTKFWNKQLIFQIFTNEGA